MCACIFRHYFSPESAPDGDSCICKLWTGVEEGVNMCLGEVVEKCETIRTWA